MSISSLSSSSDLRTSLLSNTGSVSARRTRQQDTEASALAALMSTGQQQTQPVSFRDALEDKLTAAVEAGNLSQDDADLIRQAMDQLDQQIQQGKGPGKGQGPDPSEMFSALDANGDGSLTEEEFVAGRPDDVSEEQAQAFYAELAGDTTSGLSLDQFASALASSRPEDRAGGAGRPDPTQMFSDLDADGDGVLTKEEFVAGRPDDVSEDDAGALYDKLAGENSSGLSQQQFADAMSQAGAQAAGGAGGPPPAGGGGGGGGSSEEKTEVSRTSTTSGNQTVTVITYSDGSTETTTEPAAASGTSATASASSTSSSSDSVASRLMALLQTLGGGDGSGMSFLKTAMTGRMVDVRA